MGSRHLCRGQTGGGDSESYGREEKERGGGVMKPPFNPKKGSGRGYPFPPGAPKIQFRQGTGGYPGVFYLLL